MPGINVFEVVQRLYVEHRKPIPLTDIYDRARTYYRTNEKKPTLLEFEDAIDSECALGELYEVDVTGKDERHFIDYEHLRPIDVEKVMPAVKSIPEDKVEHLIELFTKFQTKNGQRVKGCTVKEFLTFEKEKNKKFLNVKPERFEKEVLQVGLRKKLLRLEKTTEQGFGVYKVNISTRSDEKKGLMEEEIVFISEATSKMNESLIDKSNGKRKEVDSLDNSNLPDRFSNRESIESNQDEAKTSAIPAQPTRFSSRKKIKKDLGPEFVAWNSENSDYDQSVLNNNRSTSSSTILGVLRCCACSTNIRKTKKKRESDLNDLIDDRIFCFECEAKAIHTRCFLLPNKCPAYGYVKQFFCSKCRSCFSCRKKEAGGFVIECNDCHLNFHPSCFQPSNTNESPKKDMKSWICQLCSQKKMSETPKISLCGKSILQRPIGKEIKTRPIINKDSMLQSLLKSNTPNVVLNKHYNDLMVQGNELKINEKANLVIPSTSNNVGGATLLQHRQPIVRATTSTEQQQQHPRSIILPRVINTSSQSLLASKQSVSTYKNSSKTFLIPVSRAYYCNFHKFIKDRQLDKFIPLGDSYEKVQGLRLLRSLPQNVNKWNIDHVACYIKLWGYEKYSEKFVEHQINGKEMLELDVLTMYDWDIPMGVSIKLYTAIHSLKHADMESDGI